MEKIEFLVSWKTKNKNYAKIYDTWEEAIKKALIQRKRKSKNIWVTKQLDWSNETTLRITIIERHNFTHGNKI